MARLMMLYAVLAMPAMITMPGRRPIMRCVVQPGAGRGPLAMLCAPPAMGVMAVMILTERARQARCERIIEIGCAQTVRCVLKTSVPRIMVMVVRFGVGRTGKTVDAECRKIVNFRQARERVVCRDFLRRRRDKRRADRRRNAQHRRLAISQRGVKCFTGAPGFQNRRQRFKARQIQFGRSRRHKTLQHYTGQR